MRAKLFIITTFIVCLFPFCVQAQSYRLTDAEELDLINACRAAVEDFVSYLPEIAAKGNKFSKEKEEAREYIKLALSKFGLFRSRRKYKKE